MVMLWRRLLINDLNIVSEFVDEKKVGVSVDYCQIVLASDFKEVGCNLLVYFTRESSPENSVGENNYSITPAGSWSLSGVAWEWIRDRHREWEALLVQTKEYIINRHFETNHGKKFGKYNIEEKRQLAEKLTKNQQVQQQVLTRSSKGEIANTIKGATRGVDIFEGVQASQQKMGIEDFRICVSLCTDGARSMIGCPNGLIANVREFTPNVISVHCIIHQENLRVKLINMDHVNSVAVKTVKYIRSRGLNHREFQEFLRHLESQAEDVIYFTELKQKKVQELCDPLWRMDLAFLNDISQKLSQISVKLQGQNNLVHDLFKHLRTFERDSQLYEQKVDHFPTFKSVFYDNNEILDSYAQREAVHSEEFSSHFTEFTNLRREMTVFSLPCTCEISSAAVQLQHELKALQDDDIIIFYDFKDMDLIDLYKSLPAADYCNLKRFAKRFVCMLGTTYTYL
ncbi:unnamed protein product [Lepeophtheirus salmonis]|uniref:(salmon louse) hypothetical protein n=1 Tax=Lepeophtheirus salmonis TaxID=72036 RepID=A0A7R8CYX4_LEPSM|nr:unnamed protein product [Lepeophtheirus salmonis]CAF2972225.1 unnamed protein product [Lepeophtheirus salmonis]